MEASIPVADRAPDPFLAPLLLAHAASKPSSQAPGFVPHSLIDGFEVWTARLVGLFMANGADRVHSCQMVAVQITLGIALVMNLVGSVPADETALALSLEDLLADPPPGVGLQVLRIGREPQVLEDLVPFGIAVGQEKGLPLPQTLSELLPHPGTLPSCGSRC